MKMFGNYLIITNPSDMAVTTRRRRMAVHDAQNAETIGIRDEIKPTELESLRDREYRHYVCSRSPCGPLRI